MHERIISTTFASITMSGGRPTAETAKSLTDELLFQRATQVYLWALPLINTLGMQYRSDQAFGAGYNVLPIWKDRLNAKTLVTTPNSDVPYAMSYGDLGETGPLASTPRLACRAYFSTTGSGRSLDRSSMPARSLPVTSAFWGPDGGKGGKFLILPPATTTPCRMATTCFEPQPNSPAAQANIEAGDVVTAINGSPRGNWSDFTPAISAMAPGADVYLTTYRDEKLIEVKVTFGSFECPRHWKSVSTPRPPRGRDFQRQ